ncbi:MAG: hypothetical protein V4543_01885 [Bacteroidota bacterium]
MAVFKPNQAELDRCLPVDEGFLKHFNKKYEHFAEVQLQNDSFSGPDFNLFYELLFFKDLPGFNTPSCYTEVTFPSTKMVCFRFYRDNLPVSEKKFKGRLINEGRAFVLKNGQIKLKGVPLTLWFYTHKRTFLEFEKKGGIVLHYSELNINELLFIAMALHHNEAFLFKEYKPENQSADTTR